MRACFIDADDDQIPLACSHDINEFHNCRLATDGVKKQKCEHWQPGRIIKLALEILGVPDCGKPYNSYWLLIPLGIIWICGWLACLFWKG